MENTLAEMDDMKGVRVNPFDVIEAFIDKVSPADVPAFDPTDIGTPQKISRRSIALFKTSERQKYDLILTEFERLMENIVDETKTMKSVQEKLQSSLLFSHNEVMAHKDEVKALFDKHMNSLRVILSSLFGRSEIEALNAALEASDKSVGKVIATDEEAPYQMMIKFRRGRFGLFKRYKKDKHAKRITQCAFAVRDIIKNLKDTVNENDEYILAINHNRDTLKSIENSSFRKRA